MAAGILDDFHISSLDEDHPIGRFMAREFGYVRDEVLQAYPWWPAMKRAAIDPVSQAPAFGWDYAYNLPEDCLRLSPLRAGGSLDGADIPHELENGQVLTNAGGPLKIRYTQRLTNMAKWRPLMARTLAARLAMYAATRVTGKMQYFEKASAEYQRVFFEATHADSLERGTQERYSLGNQFFDDDVFTARGIY